MTTTINTDLLGYYFHPATSYCAVKVGSTKFGGTYKLAPVGAGWFISSEELMLLNATATDEEFIPACESDFVRGMEITGQDIRDELKKRYGHDYADRTRC